MKKKLLKYKINNKVGPLLSDVIEHFIIISYDMKPLYSVIFNFYTKFIYKIKCIIISYDMKLNV